MNKTELEAEADRLMHACQRAEDAGDWELFNKLSAEWNWTESVLMEVLIGEMEIEKEVEIQNQNWWNNDSTMEQRLAVCEMMEWHPSSAECEMGLEGFDQEDIDAFNSIEWSRIEALMKGHKDE